MNIHRIKNWHKVVSGIIIFIIILLFATPRIARWYIVAHGPELTGRKLAIEKIRFNYFTGTLRIGGFVMYEDDSQSVFMSFKQLKINLDYLPLLKDEIFVRSISLFDPYAQVLQSGSGFNFSSLLKTDTLKADADTLPGKTLKYNINDIRINGGYIKYTDVLLNNTIALDRLDLVIPGFTWNSDSTSLGVDFRFVGGGHLFSSLSLNVADSTYSVNLKLDSLKLGIVEPYVRNTLRFSTLHGYLSNDITVKGNMKSVMQLSVRGINHIFDFGLIDTLNRTVCSFKDLTIDIDSLRADKKMIKLNSISLTDPFILFELADSTNNWSAMLKTSTETAPDSLQPHTETSLSEDNGTYSFSKLEISGGKIQFSDKSLRYPFGYNIDNLSVKSSPAISKPGKLSLSVSAGLNGSGNFKADAILNPSNFSDLDLLLTVGQFRMKDLDAYFRHYFGFPVEGGIMNFRTENKMKAATLVSNNSVYFRKFALNGPKLRQSEYNIPLRLALGVLSDKDGIIDLKAPVEMKGEEVRVSNLGKIIFHVVGNLFVKAAVSPVNMLAGLFKVDESSLQNITLNLSDPSPDEKNMRSVDIIADIINKKPALGIDFIYCLDPQKSADTLAHILALEDFLKNNQKEGNTGSDIPDSTLVKYLTGKLYSDSATIEISDLKQLCRSYIGEKKINADIDSIRTLQTKFMVNYLGHDKGLSSDRFRIIATAPDTIRYGAAFPCFRTYFTAAGENRE